MSSAPAWLGPVVRSYRITPAVYDLVLLSAVPLALLVGAVVFGDRDELPILLVATALRRGLREARVRLPDHDAKVLLRWADERYGF